MSNGEVYISTRVDSECNHLFVLKTPNNYEKSTMFRQRTDLMSVSCFSSNTRVNRVALTATSPHMYLCACCTSGNPTRRTRGARRTPSAHRETASTAPRKRLSVALRAYTRLRDSAREGRFLPLPGLNHPPPHRARRQGTGACREVSVSHSRWGELESRLDTTATYNQRGAGGGVRRAAPRRARDPAGGRPRRRRRSCRRRRLDRQGARRR